MLLAPERINGMVQSMLQDYVEVRVFGFRLGSPVDTANKGGWLPMWKNIVGKLRRSPDIECILIGNCRD